MRRLQRAVWSGNGAGFHRLEAIEVTRVRGITATEVFELGIGLRVPRVGWVRIDARGVGLPDLEEGVRHGNAVAVEHAAGEHNALAAHAIADEDVLAAED